MPSVSKDHEQSYVAYRMELDHSLETCQRMISLGIPAKVAIRQHRTNVAMAWRNYCRQTPQRARLAIV